MLESISKVLTSAWGASLEDEGVLTVLASYGRGKTKMFRFREDEGCLAPVMDKTRDADILSQYKDAETFKSVRFLSAESWQTVLSEMTRIQGGGVQPPVQRWRIEFTHNGNCAHRFERIGSRLVGWRFWEEVQPWEGEPTDPAKDGEPTDAAKKLKSTFSDCHPWALVNFDPKLQEGSGPSTQRRHTDLVRSPPRTPPRRAHTVGTGSAYDKGNVDTEKPERCSVTVTSLDEDSPRIVFSLTAQSATWPYASELVGPHELPDAFVAE